MVQSRRHLLLAASIVLASLVILVPVAGAAEGFLVAPLRVDAKTDPGKKSTHELLIVNTMDNTTTFSVGVEDIAGSIKDADAAPILLGGVVDTPISGAGWISMSDKSFSLGPNESKRLDATVTVPRGATGGHYAAVTIAASGRKISNSLVAQSRVAVVFMLNAGNVPPPEIAIDEVVTTKPGQTIIDYVNPGQTETKPKVRIVYKDALTGETVWTSESADCSTALPNSKGRCVIPDDLKQQHSNPLSPLLVGFAEVVNEGKTARVPLPRQWSGSWSSSLLPLVGLGLLVLFFFVRVRRRREADGDGQDALALP